MLLNGVNDLIDQLGKAVSMAGSDKFMRPYIRIAQDEYIIPAIGNELFAELDAACNASVPELSSDQLELLPFLQRALAYYAYYRYLPFSIGTDGDLGLQETEGDKSKPVRIGILDQRRRASIEMATTALELALGLLFTWPESYPAFKTSKAYTEIRTLLISQPADIARYLPQTKGNYRLFLALKPYLMQAERGVIRATLGSAFYDDLKAKWQAGTCNADELELVDMVAFALCSEAYHEAMFHLNIVQLPSGNLRVMSDFDGIYNQRNITDDQLALAQQKAEVTAKGHLTSLKSFLNDNAGLFTLYSNSERNKTGMPDNSKYTGIFRMHR